MLEGKKSPGDLTVRGLGAGNNDPLCRGLAQSPSNCLSSESEASSIIMSLWDSLTILLQHCAHTTHLGESLASVLSNKSEADRAYSKAIEKLVGKDLFQSKDSVLDPQLWALKEALLVLCTEFGHLAEYGGDMAMGLQTAISRQNEETKGLKGKMSKLNNERVKVQKGLEKTREKYRKACRTEGKDVEGDAKRNYTEHIALVNYINQDYLENAKKTLVLYQKSEETKLVYLQGVLRNTIEFQKGVFTVFTEQFDLLLPEIEVFEVNQLFETFVNINETGKLLTTMRFEPFSEASVTPEVLASSESLNKIMNKCWESVTLTPFEFSVFSAAVSTATGRKTWIRKLNEKRISSQFEVTETGFNDLSFLMCLTLDKMLRDLDYSETGLLIVLSQTFFRNSNEQALYIDSVIKEHDIWKSMEVWEKLMTIGVDKELSNFARDCLGNEEVDDDLPERIKEILTSQLVAISHIMVVFSIEHSQIKEFILVFISRYRLSERYFHMFNLL